MQVPGKAIVVPVAAAMCLTLTTVGCGEQTVEDRIADTMRRTEDIRGLKALEPVEYRFLPAEDAFDDLLAEWLASDDAQETEAEALVLQRLGLLPLELDILEVLDWSTRTGVLGYYEPQTERMTIVSHPDEVGPGELMVLAHEHAHALQDQHFDLESHDAQVDDDEATAIDALIEGEATLVMAVWVMKRLGTAGLEALEASDIPTDFAPIHSVPAILARAGEFPYVDGLAFVFAQWGEGDWDAIDALWQAPPVSSEQIMHPERYPHDVPDSIELPDVAPLLGPGWTTASEMVMGEMQIGVLLADGEPWEDAADSEAFTFPRLENAHAAEGWGGDRLAHVTGPDDAWAIVWQTTWDSADDADEFAATIETAFGDLPFSTSIGRGTDISGAGHPHPVLVLVSSDDAMRGELLTALEAL